MFISSTGQARKGTGWMGLICNGSGKPMACAVQCLCHIERRWHSVRCLWYVSSLFFLSYYVDLRPTWWGPWSDCETSRCRKSMIVAFAFLPYLFIRLSILPIPYLSARAHTPLISFIWHIAYLTVSLAVLLTHFFQYFLLSAYPPPLSCFRSFLVLRWLLHLFFFPRFSYFVYLYLSPFGLRAECAHIRCDSYGFDSDLLNIGLSTCNDTFFTSSGSFSASKVASTSSRYQMNRHWPTVYAVCIKDAAYHVLMRVADLSLLATLILTGSLNQNCATMSGGSLRRVLNASQHTSTGSCVWVWSLRFLQILSADLVTICHFPTRSITQPPTPQNLQKPLTVFDRYIHNNIT